MILLDTSGLLAALFPDQRRHEECAQALLADSGPFVLSPFVLAEVGCLIGRHAGAAAQRALLKDVAAGAYELADFERGEVERAERILEQDQRHFRALRGDDHRPFHLAPLDD